MTSGRNLHYTQNNYAHAQIAEKDGDSVWKPGMGVEPI